MAENRRAGRRNELERDLTIFNTEENYQQLNEDILDEKVIVFLDRLYSDFDG